MTPAAGIALARRTFADARSRTVGFALLFVLVAYAQPAAYRSDYPTLRDRLGFVHAFAGNASVRLFYGGPLDLLSVGGYSAWRVGGILAIFSGAWGMLAAVRALRAEEDSGRAEVLAAAPISRVRMFTASVCGCLAGVLLLWGALLAGLLAGGLPAGGSAYLALADRRRRRWCSSGSVRSRASSPRRGGWRSSSRAPSCWSPWCCAWSPTPPPRWAGCAG